MSMKKFTVEFSVGVEIEISDELLAGVLTDEWRSSFYKLFTPADVAEHLAYNLVRGSSVTSLDGFADRKDDEVTFKDDWDVSSSQPVG